MYLFLQLMSMIQKKPPRVFLLGVSAVLEAVWTFMMLDMLTDVCRKTRPYEINKEKQTVYTIIVLKCWQMA